MRSTRRAFIILLALCCTVCCTASLSSCRSTPPPPLEDIYDTAVSLIEASYAVNDLVFGHGLPVWAVESGWAALYRLYSDNDYADYEYVTEYAPIITLEQLRTAISAVYSADYAASLFVTLFDGVSDGLGIQRARFSEDEKGLYQSIDHAPLVTWQRIYDYSSMRIVSPSNAGYVTLEIDSYLPGEQDKPLAVRLGLGLENGQWRLDTPTF